MKYRLEYNEKQNMWHYENPSKDNANTYGWVTIDNNQEEKKISLFTHIMDEVLSQLGDCAKTDIIIKTWEAFDEMYEKLGFSILVKDEDEIN